MALPPRPMGSLVDSAMAPSGADMDPSAVDVSVLAPENFEGGASVTEDGEGGAVIQALAAAMEEMSEEELIPHNANLAEYLDDGYLGEPTRYDHTGELPQSPYFGVFQTSSVGSPRTFFYTTISADISWKLLEACQG